MSLVQPFNARVYQHESGADLSALVAPPYDVVSPEHREALLARHARNVVALELPDGPLDETAPGSRYENGRATWRTWHDDGTLVDDDTPAIYVLQQDWTYRGIPVRRRAFVGAVRLHAFSEGVILPHERTLPKAIADRLALTRATAANLSQVFGLFSDAERVTDAVLDMVTAGTPEFHATDDDGVVSRVWAIRDAETIAAVTAAIGDGPIFIADGHHRYTTALAYRDERRAADAAAGRSPADPAYDRVMMALVNMDDPDLLVLPTHRLARAEGDFDAVAFWSALARWFDLTEPPAGHPDDVLAATGATAFYVRTADGTARLATLRADVDPVSAIRNEHGPDWKRLDVAVLQELILRPLFGIAADDATSLERLTFVKDAEEALRVEGADAAFVVAPTRMDQLRAVALAGETMPQKSTYFYPKLLSGLLLRPLS